MSVGIQNTIYWHADDLGLSQGITQSIVRCFDVLNSVSVIVNGTDISGAAEAIKQYDKNYPPMRVVLHLNFMEGRALSGTSVICPRGVFEKDFLAFWYFVFKNRRDKVGFEEAIYAETLHQIQAFEEVFGRVPKAVDCHHHMHMIPSVAKAVARAMSQKGIPYIRIPNDYIWVRSPVVNMGKYALLKFLAYKNRHIWQSYNISAPTLFFGVLPTGTAHADIYESAILQHKRWHPPLEILFHPGKAYTVEYENWQNRPALWAYYGNIQRDNEADVLRKLYKQYKENGHKNT